MSLDSNEMFRETELSITVLTYITQYP
jgi:hypothetical protein